MTIGLQIIFMDAGQGDATLITLGDGESILVDCGSKKNINVVWEGIAANLARTNKKLKALVLTHPDGDHYNLVKALVIDAGITVGTTYCGGQTSDYRGVDFSKLGKVAQLGKCVHDTSPRADLSTFGKADDVVHDIRIIAANIGDVTDVAQRNLNSIVLFIRYLEFNILLMGDSTTDTEDFIVKADKANGYWLTKMLSNGGTVLKVGHHGSLTSTSEAWVKFTKPQVATISSDTKAFGGVSLPRSTVINRLLLVIRDKAEPHYYVQYNDSKDVHEAVATTRFLWTTLNKLTFNADRTTFTAKGGDIYYQINTDGSVNIKGT
jgi:beta-lactamase superfamily II metal-dependent hydrolase